MFVVLNEYEVHREIKTCPVGMMIISSLHAPQQRGC